MAAAPFLGEIRDLLLDRFDPRISLGLVLLTVLGAAGVGLRALVRQEATQRRRTISGLLLVGGLVVLERTFFRTGNLRVDVVEVVHIVSYGAFAFLVARAGISPRRPGGLLLPVLAGTLLGVADETVQWIAPQRTGDLRDVGLDTFGAVCGTLLALFTGPPLVREPLCVRQRRRLARFAAAAVLAVGAFTSVAHLGYEVHDPEIGVFRSVHPRARLLELQEERTREWAVDPPTELPVIGVEDRFLTEAAWHALHRNAQLNSGDFANAWAANRVLELYYAPFLDLESFRGSGRHRWDAALRDRVEEERPPHHPESYESPVARERIRTRPGKGPFLLFVAAAAAASLLLEKFTRPRS